MHPGHYCKQVGNGQKGIRLGPAEVCGPKQKDRMLRLSLNNELNSLQCAFKSTPCVLLCNKGQIREINKLPDHSFQFVEFQSQSHKRLFNETVKVHHTAVHCFIIEHGRIRCSSSKTLQECETVLIRWEFCLFI